MQRSVTSWPSPSPVLSPISCCLLHLDALVGTSGDPVLTVVILTVWGTGATADPSRRIAARSSQGAARQTMSQWSVLRGPPTVARCKLLFRRAGTDQWVGRGEPGPADRGDALACDMLSGDPVHQGQLEPRRPLVSGPRTQGEGSDGGVTGHNQQ